MSGGACWVLRQCASKASVKQHVPLCHGPETVLDHLKYHVVKVRGHVPTHAHTHTYTTMLSLPCAGDSSYGRVFSCVLTGAILHAIFPCTLLLTSAGLRLGGSAVCALGAD